MNLFADPLHDEFAAWATGFITANGADFGEIVAIADRLGPDADDDAYVTEWSAVAASHVRAADAAEAGGHRATAHGHLLRAAAYDGVAVHMLYGSPVDPRLVQSFDRITDAFGRAMGLRDEPGESFTYEVDGHELPAWFLPAAGSQPGEARPVVIVSNGYDATIADGYLGLGRAVVERGFHCVHFDGPGQGAALVHHGLALVPDWERVITPLVDIVAERPDVDPDRIALHGWSLGGYLAARAASVEHRLAACICDPPLWDMLGGMVPLAAKLGSPEAAADLPDISDEAAARILAAIESDRGLTWKIIKRGFWVNGATDLPSYFHSIAPFTMDGHADGIRCPLFASNAEGDPNAMGVADFMAKLSCPTTLVPFTAADGAGGHCEMQNRWLLNQTWLDWLDDVFSAA
jgi:hypothetical protein